MVVKGVVKGSMWGVVMALLPGVVAAGASLSLGAEYREGDYGTGASTTSWSLPLGIGLYGERFSASLSIPYVSIEGASSVSVSGRPLQGRGPGSGTTTTTTTRSSSGLGDIGVTGGLRLLNEQEAGVAVDLTGKIKVATADETEGLGSGENDYALELGMGREILYGYVGYKWLGDSATADYSNVGYGGLSLMLPVGERTGLGLAYYAEEAALSGSDSIQELTLSLRSELSPSLGVSLYAGAGLTDSSADAIMGATLTHYID